MNFEVRSFRADDERAHKTGVESFAEINQSGWSFSWCAEEGYEDAIDSSVLIDQRRHDATLLEAGDNSFDSASVRAPYRVDSVGLSHRAERHLYIWIAGLFANRRERDPTGDSVRGEEIPIPRVRGQRDDRSIVLCPFKDRVPLRARDVGEWWFQEGV